MKNYLNLIILTFILLPSTQSNLHEPQEFDYIIVGAGTAGGVIGGRLAEQEGVSILVLESGQDVSHLPEGRPTMFPGYPNADKNNPFLGKDFSNETTSRSSLPLLTTHFRWYPAHALGGATSLYTAVLNHLSEEDRINWNQSDWTAERVKYYTNKYETFVDFNNLTHGEIEIAEGLRGGSGPMRVTMYPQSRAATRSLIETCAATYQLPIVYDTNAAGVNTKACAQVQRLYGGNATNILRSTTYQSYILAHSHNHRLVVMENSTVTKVILEDEEESGLKVAKSVKYFYRGELYTAKARKAIVLSASILGSPKILQLSGIGDAQQLRNSGVTPVLNLPQVGKNVREKVVCAAMVFETSQTLDIDHIITISSYHTNIDTIDNHNVNVFSAVVINPVPAGQATFAFINQVVHTSSNGTIQLLSNNAFDAPLFKIGIFDSNIRPASLSYSMDMANCLELVNDTYKYINNLAASFNMTFFQISPSLSQLSPSMTDAQKLPYLEQNSDAGFQPIGACRMGKSVEDSVVDQNLLVHKTKNLYVSDITVIPEMTIGPPSGVALMLGEYLADHLKYKVLNEIRLNFPIQLVDLFLGVISHHCIQ